MIQNKLTDISSLNHTDIIAAIAYTANAFLCKCTNKTCNICLLGWGTSTGDDSRKFGCNLDEFVLEQVQT